VLLGLGPKELERFSFSEFNFQCENNSRKNLEIVLKH
jgi:hypothetical protein